MHFLIVATTLRPGKGTAWVAQTFGAACASQKSEDELLDLSSASLPWSDGSLYFEDPSVLVATARERSNKAAIPCFQVYSDQADAAAKNFVEVTSDSSKSIVVGLVASGCTDRSYLAPLSLANSLMGDHRCVIDPRSVFVTPEKFTADGVLAADGETACASPIYLEMSRNSNRTGPRKNLPPDLSTSHDTSL